MRKMDNVAQKREIASRLREIRTNLGLTQEKFAEILELSVSAYKKVENSENQISIDSLRKIEERLKVSSDYILFGKYKDADEIWKLLLNCSEHDKMLSLLRLINYFTKIKGGHYLTQEVQSLCDEKLLSILKEMDI